MYAGARVSAITRTRVGLFLLFQALYALTSSGNAFRIPDEFELYFQTEHLIDAGDISVPQTLQLQQPVIVDGKVVGSQSILFGKIGQDGKPYAPYGPLAALLAVPHHLAGRALAALFGIPRVPPPQGLAWVIFVGGITMLSTATAAALTVAGFHRAAIALGTLPGPALWLSLLLGGATVLWPYGTSFFTEAWQAAAFVWAAALLLEARTAETPAIRIAIAGLLIALAGLTKVTSLVFAPAFVIAVLCDRTLSVNRRVQAAAVLVGGILFATAVHFSWNAYRFGSPFDFGYDWSETIPILPPRTFSIVDLPRGLAVLLVAPGKSIFLWAPVTVLALLNAGRSWRREPALTSGIGAALAIGLLFYGGYLFVEGGYSHGPRHLVPIVPLLILAAAGPDASRWSRPALLACGAIGLVMALLATGVSFLEDQALRRNANGQPVEGYYEIVDPAPGRPNNRYRLGYVPFALAMSTPGWSSSPALGQGPDYFVLHLQQARRQLPDGQAIPASFSWIWAALWVVVIGAAAFELSRQQRVNTNDRNRDNASPTVDSEAAKQTRM